MNLNIKWAALIGASAVATAAAIYAAIAIHNKKEQDAKLKASEDLFKEFEEASVMALSNNKNSGFEQCKVCPNVGCPYCGMANEDCGKSKTSDDWSSDVECNTDQDDDLIDGEYMDFDEDEYDDFNDADGDNELFGDIDDSFGEYFEGDLDDITDEDTELDTISDHSAFEGDDSEQNWIDESELSDDTSDDSSKR